MPYCCAPSDIQRTVYMSPFSAAEFVCEPFSIESSMHDTDNTKGGFNLENTDVNRIHDQHVPSSNGLCATRSLPDIKRLATFFQPGVHYTVPFDTQGAWPGTGLTMLELRWYVYQPYTRLTPELHDVVCLLRCILRPVFASQRSFRGTFDQCR
jgi:hypothetical protein